MSSFHLPSQFAEEYFFENHIEPGMRVLDLGCGVGRTTRYIKDRGADVVGVDMVQAFLDRGMQVHPDLDLRYMNAAELEFQDKTFDVVLFPNQGIDCTHPRSRREDVLREARRVLKDDGMFMYTHHNSTALPKTKRTRKDFMKNLLKLRFGYHHRTENHENGDLTYAFNNIWNEERFIHDAGFSVIDILANHDQSNKSSRLAVGFLERWPMYICKKSK